jgi:hypothetical protein
MLPSTSVRACAPTMTLGFLAASTAMLTVALLLSLSPLLREASNTLRRLRKSVPSSERWFKISNPS